MSLDEFHFHLTEVDGKEAIWFEEFERHKMIVKPFVFDFRDKNDDGSDWYCDIPYTIKLGGRELSSYLSEWSNDLEEIRHSIEHYVFTGMTRIKLHFEDSPTEIRLKRMHFNQQVIDGKRSFCWKDYVRVLVKPNGFIKDDGLLFGVCDERQVIRRIYEAFLYVGKLGYKYNVNDRENPWDYPPITFYNKIKSPIIEDFISGKEVDYNEVRVRQVKVEHTLKICACPLCFLWQEGGVGCEGPGIFDDIVEFDLDGKEYKIPVPGIYRWYEDFQNAADFSEATIDENFVIDAWNKQGLELAAKIREQLPPSIDLWYQYPFEDEKNRGKRPMLIY